MHFTRREFLKLSGAAAVMAAVPGYASFGVRGENKYPLEEILEPDNYKKLTAHWDPIFGPEVETSRFYGGRADFEGHRRYFGAGGGLDFYAHEGTPIVPPAAGMVMDAPPLSQRSGICLRILHERGRNGKLGTDPGTVTSEYRHLYSITVEPRFRFVQSEYDKGHRYSYLRRNEVCALSGATGDGPFQGKQHPHLHWETFKREGKYGVVPYEAFDQEKWGIDKDYPRVFWDGKTALDYYPVHQFLILKRTVEKYATGMKPYNPESHQDKELYGKLGEYASLALRSNGKEISGKDVLDSKYFIDMKDLVKDEVLRKKKYHPGTEPYSTMLEILGYGKEPSQQIVFTLPFISPHVVHLYNKPKGEEGLFRNNQGYFFYKGKSWRLTRYSEIEVGPKSEEWQEFLEIRSRSDL